jgi:hypothetical protein
LLAPVVHILPLTSLRRERLLPVPGHVIAHVDQKVSPLDVVAKAHYGQKHLLVDVASTLGIQPEAAQRLIQVKAGERVANGQEIARRSGLIPRILRAPSNGQVIFIGNGRILLEAGDETFDLLARIPGKVTRQIDERGVEITFNGALVQGVWGNGQMGLGLMLPVITAPDELLSVDQINLNLRNLILLAGHCNDPAVLLAAAELPVRGMILASLSPALVLLAAQMQYPIILLEGFGLKSMDSAAYKLLMNNAKHEVTLNAEPFDRQAGKRPEIFIPLSVTQEPPLYCEVVTFTPEQLVRLTRTPHVGEVGTLVRILPGLTTIPSGLRVAVAEVELDYGDRMIVPLANLEVLG